MIRGTVVIEGTSPVQVLPNAPVHLGAIRGTRFALLGETRTGPDGRFSFDLDSLPNIDSGASHLEVRVLSDAGERRPAHGDTRWRRDIDPGPLVVCVEPDAVCATPPETVPQGIPGANNVWGRVRHTDGTPLPNVIVEVRQVTIAGEPLLVGVNTDGAGWYAATITPPKDILVKVLEPAQPPAQPRLLGTSRALYQPAFPVRVDVDICDEAYRRATEWSRLSGAVTPLLAGTQPQNLDTRKVAVLSGRTGWDVERIALWSLAHRIGLAIPADVESIYGLLRLGFPRTKESLLSRPISTVGPALERAANLNIIARAKSVSPAVDNLLAALKAGLKGALGGTRADTLGQILRASGVLQSGQVDEFISFYVDHQGTEEAFWTQLPSRPTFNQSAADQAMRLVTLGRLALSYAPAVSSILVTIGAAPASAVATIDAAGWDTIVSPGRLPTLPQGLPGATDGDRRDALAAYLAEHAERAFPSSTARTGLIAALGAGHPLEPAKVFLTNNPSFDIATSRVDDVAFSGNEAQKTAAKRAQRLYRVAPGTGRAGVVASLGNAGFTSAWSIARRTRARFVAEYAGTLGADVAEAVARRASLLNAITTTFLLQAHPRDSLTELRFLNNVAFDTGDVADWEEMFGNVDGCACRHCRSVHGPAAYLVDLLQWLAARDASDGSGDSLYDKLVARRPDLVEIGLSCENAERALPYIDLVLEALESAVANAGTVGEDAAHDSVVTTADMLAAPQYRNDTVYDTTLVAATSAVRLPFHRPLEEARAFLDHLGVPRRTLLDAFESAGTLTATDLATEELSLFGARLATITAATGSEAAYWPVALAELASVATLRRAAELSWPDVLDLLHARYVNPRTWNPTTSSWDRLLEVTATDWCDLDTYTIALVGGGAPAEADWTRLRQFLRLWRTLGWSVLDVDKVLDALDIDDLSADVWLEDVAHVHRLAALTGLSPVDLAMTRASSIDTYEDRDSREEPVTSLYDRTFLSPAVVVAEDPEYATFVLNDKRDALVTTGEVIGDHAAAVAAALGVTRDELEALPGDPAIDALSLANLTTLYAWVIVCRATRLRPEDAVGLATMAGLDPLVSLSDLAELVETAGEVAAAGWTVDELRYLVSHERAERVAPADDFVQLTLGRLRDALRAAFEAIGEGTTEASVREEALRVLAEELGADKDALDGVRMLAWSELPTLATGTGFTLAEDAGVASSAPVTVAVPAAARCVVPTGAAITRNGIPETLADDTEALLDSTTSGSTTALRVAQGTAWALASGGDATFATATAFTVPYASLPSTASFTAANGDAIVLTASTSVQFPDGVAHAAAGPITGSLSFASAPPAPDILQRFLRTAFLTGGTPQDTPYDDITDAGTYAGDFETLRALHKAIVLLRHLDLDDEERAWWFDAEHTTAWGLAAVDGLSGSAAATFGFTQLKALVALFGLRRRLPGSSPTFVELLTAATLGPTQFAASLAARSGWNEADIEDLGEQAGAGPDSVDGLTTLLDRLAITRRIGVDAGTVTSWAIAPGSVSAPSSAEVVAAARARYPTDETWAQVARPVRDVLRKAQRDALVAWLLAEVGDEDVEDADDLYEHYLIDVSMNPEVLTSRIVQACATVQLYVHRLMLGLERDPTSGDMVFEPNDEDREQWEWMRAYRVWEAARKVFLYPENWIEPELRDDKTPFFRDLERELAQGDATDDRVEQAVLDYLDRLREVSNLQVLAYYWQSEDLAGADDVDVLHVFARTRSEPPSYWYRRFEDGRTWTAWEKVEAGVQGSHLVPVVYERRLCLFWLEVKESDSSNTESTCWDIAVAWSEYRDGKWAPKRVSSASKLDNAWGETTRISQEPYMVRSDEDDQGRIVLHVTYREDRVNGDINAYPVARFVLDPCTFELTLQDAANEQASAGDKRRAAVSTFWYNPGFQTEDDPDDEQTWWATTLTLYKADTDAENEAVGDPIDYTEAAVLGSAADLTVVVPGQYRDFVSQSPFFVQSPTRSWFVTQGSALSLAVGDLAGQREGTYVPQDNPPSATDPNVLAQWVPYLPAALYLDDASGTGALGHADALLISASVPAAFNLEAGGYRFFVFYHPHVCTFTEAVRRDGLFALIDPDPDGPEGNLSTGSLLRQQVVGSFDFEAELLPDPDNVDPRYPVEDVDFTDSGAYAQYNWELFFHVPFYVASRLMDSGRHDDAMRYLHAIFDPRVPDTNLPATVDASARWWKVAPFLEPVSAPVTDWIAFTGAAGDPVAASDFAAQVRAWQRDPFNPHLLARLRPGTYPKATVMRYVENLIAWGDQLFTRDTLETLNEATQLYVFARQILGDRPETPEPRNAPTTKTYAQLLSEGTLDEFSNVILENAYTGDVPASGTGGSTGSSTGLTAYFCIPQNPQLLSYWDIVEDRLFKIRNGMNIEGVVRTLPLFEPPIDPALLVRAAAAGIDIGTALDGLDVSLPHHRFQVVHGRAAALAASVRSLGQTLLATLEKKDAEALANLRQGHEIALLDAVGDVRDKQVDEAERALEAVRRSRVLVRARKTYYDKLQAKGWIGEETAAAALTAAASIAEVTAGVLRLVQAGAGVTPDVYAGAPAVLVTKTGGENLSRIPAATAASFEIGAAGARGAAAYLSTAAGYKRRAQEWKHQADLAEKELGQIEKQIAAAEIRLEIARRERRNHQLQSSHAEQVQDFFARKFTNEELYRWMSGQLGTLYFQQYQLALAMAKKAQACFNHELGRSDTFVQAVYWDSLRKGLLAGDRLAADLERMDAAYVEHDEREHELTRAISLRLLDPLALERLRTDGECYVSVPEDLLDLDCPTHYMRRIQSVAVSVACVAGPQGNVNVRLTLQRSRIRRVDSTAAADLEDETWVDYPSIVTSVAVNDSGLFQTDLRDPRYLPFERRGAIGIWHVAITSSAELKQFDWTSIEDVTLHLRYTARDGSNARTPDLGALDVGLPGSIGAPVATGFVRLVGLARDFSEGLGAAQDAHETSLTFSVGSALRAPVTAQPLIGAIAVPSGGAGPSAFRLNGEAAASATHGSGVTYYLWSWSSSPPNLDNPVTLKHGDETSRQSPVLDRLNAPPASPSDGDRYLVTGTASGAFAGHEDDVAEYDEGTTSWGFTTPASGTAVYVEDEAAVYVFDTSWAVADWDFDDVDDVTLVLLYGNTP